MDAPRPMLKRRKPIKAIVRICPHRMCRCGRDGNENRVAIQKEIFCLVFYLEKPLEFWLEIPYTNQKFKNRWFRQVAESEWNLQPFFKAKLKLIFLCKWHIYFIPSGHLTVYLRMMSYSVNILNCPFLILPILSAMFLLISRISR